MAENERKQAEIRFFAELPEEGRRFTRGKPFTDPSRGHLLVDLGQILALLPPPPARLLDLGCGSGWTTAIFAQSGYDALGVDLAPAAIDMARGAQAASGARFECADYEALAFAQEFDAAVLYDALHHSNDVAAVLASAFRALRPGGLLVITEPGRGHQDSADARFMRAEHGLTERDMPPSATVPLLRAAGFSEVRIAPRLNLQLATRYGTGRRRALARRLVGRLAADALLAFWSAVKARHNGVVVAVR